MNFQDQQLAALLEALQGSGSLDQSNQLLGQQQQTAQANRSQAAGAHSYGWGAGLGNGISQVFGALQQHKLGQQQQANAEKQGDYSSHFLRALQQLLGGGQQQDLGMSGGNLTPTTPPEM